MREKKIEREETESERVRQRKIERQRVSERERDTNSPASTC